MILNNGKYQLENFVKGQKLEAFCLATLNKISLPIFMSQPNTLPIYDGPTKSTPTHTTFQVLRKHLKEQKTLK